MTPPGLRSSHTVNLNTLTRGTDANVHILSQKQAFNGNNMYAEFTLRPFNV